MKKICRILFKKRQLQGAGKSLIRQVRLRVARAHRGPKKEKKGL